MNKIIALLRIICCYLSKLRKLIFSSWLKKNQISFYIGIANALYWILFKYVKMSFTSLRFYFCNFFSFHILKSKTRFCRSFRLILIIKIYLLCCLFWIVEFCQMYWLELRIDSNIETVEFGSKLFPFLFIIKKSYNVYIIK